MRFADWTFVSESKSDSESPAGRLPFAGALSLLLSVLFCSLVPASSQTGQFLPQVNISYKVNPTVRLNLQAKETREAGDPTQAEIGPSLDLFAKPLVSLENIPIFDPDLAKSRLLQWSIGYRNVSSPDEPIIARLQMGFISNFPLPAKVLMTNRNRANLDWSTEPFVWRYQNRVQLQRAVSIRSYRPAPYASAEVFYQSKCEKWSTTALSAGCLFPIHARLAIEIYYEHQNQTGKHPNEQLNQLGLTLNVYTRTSAGAVRNRRARP